MSLGDLINSSHEIHKRGPELGVPNIITSLKVLSIIMYCVGGIVFLLLLDKFSQPFLFSKGRISIFEVLIALVVVFYHILIGTICFGIKEILEQLHEGKNKSKRESMTTNNTNESNNNLEKNASLTKKELKNKLNELAEDNAYTDKKIKEIKGSNDTNDQSQVKLSQQFVENNIPLLDNIDNIECTNKIKFLFDQEQKNIIKVIDQLIETENERKVLEEYSDLTYHEFLSKGKNYKYLGNSELLVYRQILDEFIIILEENDIVFKKQIGNNPLKEKENRCNKCGKELVKKKTKDGRHVLVCSNYPDCKNISYI